MSLPQFNPGDKVRIIQGARLRGKLLQGKTGVVVSGPHVPPLLGEVYARYIIQLDAVAEGKGEDFERWMYCDEIEAAP